MLEGHRAGKVLQRSGDDVGVRLDRCQHHPDVGAEREGDDEENRDLHLDGAGEA
jgi:hypothetical protein